MTCTCGQNQALYAQLDEVIAAHKDQPGSLISVPVSYTHLAEPAGSITFALTVVQFRQAAGLFGHQPNGCQKQFGAFVSHFQIAFFGDLIAGAVCLSHEGTVGYLAFPIEQDEADQSVYRRFGGLDRDDGLIAVFGSALAIDSAFYQIVEVGQLCAAG